ncbi:class I ribonucleotide reductase maintenance protein YfaE [Thalassotalea aquiviva]|uniref:class I ribonucleotide reductase maintenance protein YfaE n=1 Tax=Thalassotalea aquiviva TaxID=3242415 RepID=UPI00352BAF84
MSHKVKVNGEVVEQAFDNLIHKTTLEFLEANQVEVHYHCRDGFCGACRAVLNAGEVTYHKGEPLAFIRDNEILPCYCIPKSDIDITIE